MQAQYHNISEEKKTGVQCSKQTKNNAVALFFVHESVAFVLASLVNNGTHKPA